MFLQVSRTDANVLLELDPEDMHVKKQSNYTAVLPEAKVSKMPLHLCYMKLLLLLISSHGVCYDFSHIASFPSAVENNTLYQDTIHYTAKWVKSVNSLHEPADDIANSTHQQLRKLANACREPFQHLM